MKNEGREGAAAAAIIGFLMHFVSSVFWWGFQNWISVPCSRQQGTNQKFTQQPAGTWSYVCLKEFIFHLEDVFVIVVVGKKTHNKDRYHFFFLRKLSAFLKFTRWGKRSFVPTKLTSFGKSSWLSGTIACLCLNNEEFGLPFVSRAAFLHLCLDGHSFR